MKLHSTTVWLTTEQYKLLKDTAKKTNYAQGTIVAMLLDALGAGELKFVPGAFRRKEKNPGAL